MSPFSRDLSELLTKYGLMESPDELVNLVEVSYDEHTVSVVVIHIDSGQDGNPVYLWETRKALLGDLPDGEADRTKEVVVHAGDAFHPVVKRRG